ncbi:MAG: VWA domain-containing protein [Propionicimonas sp.]|nr:VWA domain-containing protein [Propionicimonas sp.]
MTVAWPWALTALAAVPVLAGFWWAVRRHRRRHAVRVPSVLLLRAALPARSLWRRRLAVALFGAGLVLTGVAVARPHAAVAVPVESSTTVLAIDVSGSMCSTDVDPNRLVVAQEAARSFIAAQDGPVGLVAFAGFAGLLVEPTTDAERLDRALDGLRTWRGTAIGMAILASIDAIAETNPAVAPTGVRVTADRPPEVQPDVIVVLTDGANTRGLPPAEAAELAAARGLRVYTIGFGTSEPAPLVCNPGQVDPTGGFARRGWNQEIEEDTLIEVAEMTGGEYFRAEDAAQLTQVLLDLPRAVVLQTRQQEVTAWFVLAGLVLVSAGVLASLWWNRPRQARRRG